MNYCIKIVYPTREPNMWTSWVYTHGDLSLTYKLGEVTKKLPRTYGVFVYKYMPTCVSGSNKFQPLLCECGSIRPYPAKHELCVPSLLSEAQEIYQHPTIREKSIHSDIYLTAWVRPIYLVHNASLLRGMKAEDILDKIRSNNS